VSSWVPPLAAVWSPECSSECSVAVPWSPWSPVESWPLWWLPQQNFHVFTTSVGL
jgi:hypothetical protein